MTEKKVKPEGGKEGVPLLSVIPAKAGIYKLILIKLDEIPRSSRGMTKNECHWNDKNECHWNDRKGMSFPRKPCPRPDRGCPRENGGLSPRKRGLVPVKTGTGE